METALSIETQTKIGLLSKALILIGETPLQSLSDDRYGATVGSGLFELIYENELQSNPWRFSMKKTTLSRLVATPLNQYAYAYQLPSDCLLLRHVYPRSQYEVFGDRLYSDATSVEIDYQFKPDITSVPAYFSMLMVYALARDMVKPITESDTGVKTFAAKYVMQRDRAMYADAQARPATPVQDNPFVDVRGV
jgi:hypothetical protein